MLLGRFFLIIPVLAIGGSLVRKQAVPVTAGHLPDHGPALRRAADRRHADRRRPHLLPRPRPGPDRGAPQPVTATAETAHPRPRSREPGEHARDRHPLPTRSLARRDDRPPGRRSTPSRSSTRGIQAKNPVMFVVEVGSVLTTILCSRPRRQHDAGTASPAWWRRGCGSPSCSPTSPRRWPRAGARPRPPRSARPGRRPSPAAGEPTARSRRCPSTALTVGDLCVVTAGEVIPGDGDVVEGIASVDESAITGESAPVVRESGGDRSAVTGGTRVLSDEIVVPHHGQARRVVPRPHDRPRRGLVPPEDPERDRPLDPARRPHDHLPAGRGDPPALRQSTSTPSSRSSCSSPCSSA